MEPQSTRIDFVAGNSDGSRRLRLIAKPLVRQAKLGAFLQGESPCGVRINHPLLPSVATATAEVKTEQVS